MALVGQDMDALERDQLIRGVLARAIPPLILQRLGRSHQNRYGCGCPNPWNSPPIFRRDFSGDWDVHWGANRDLDPWPYGQVRLVLSFSEHEGFFGRGFSLKVTRRGPQPIKGHAAQRGKGTAPVRQHTCKCTPRQAPALRLGKASWAFVRVSCRDVTFSWVILKGKPKGKERYLNQSRFQPEIEAARSSLDSLHGFG